MNASLNDLKNFMDTAVAKLGVSGIDCIVYKDHQQIFRHMSGFSDMENQTPVRPDAFYNIYSATKVVTCTAALQLLEKGIIRLNDPLSDYLPEFSKMQVKSGTFCIKPAQKPIRLADLFCMTAGLSYEIDTPEKRQLVEETKGDFGTREFAAAIAREPLLFEPGEGWNYSYCHDVLAAVVEVCSGQRLGEYLEKNIFLPLGMKEASFSLPQEKLYRLAPQYQYDRATQSVCRISDKCLGAAGLKHESGGGGLICTAEDYILFADALACGGVGKTKESILSPRTIALLAHNQLDGKALMDFRNMVPSPGIGYGLGVAVITDSSKAYTLAPEKAFYWGGMGGVQNLFDPQNRLSFFVAQHTVGAPKELMNPNMLNILYAAL